MFLGTRPSILLLSFRLFLLGISHTSKTVQPLSFGLPCSEQPGMLNSLQRGFLYTYIENDVYSFDTKS